MNREPSSAVSIFVYCDRGHPAHEVAEFWRRRTSGEWQMLFDLSPDFYFYNDETREWGRGPGGRAFEPPVVRLDAHDRFADVLSGDERDDPTRQPVRERVQPECPHCHFRLRVLWENLTPALDRLAARGIVRVPLHFLKKCIDAANRST